MKKGVAAARRPGKRLAKGGSVLRRARGAVARADEDVCAIPGHFKV